MLSMIMSGRGGAVLVSGDEGGLLAGGLGVSEGIFLRFLAFWASHSILLFIKLPLVVLFRVEERLVLSREDVDSVRLRRDFRPPLGGLCLDSMEGATAVWPWLGSPDEDASTMISFTPSRSCILRTRPGSFR